MDLMAPALKSLTQMLKALAAAVNPKATKKAKGISGKLHEEFLDIRCSREKTG